MTRESGNDKGGWEDLSRDWNDKRLEFFYPAGPSARWRSVGMTFDLLIII
ncbi:MAG: hypothetical protein ACYTFM_03190 [Planctomycetota bacterium]